MNLKALVQKPLVYLIIQATHPLQNSSWRTDQQLIKTKAVSLCLKVLAVVSNTSCVWCRLHSGWDGERPSTVFYLPRLLILLSPNQESQARQGQFKFGLEKNKNLVVKQLMSPAPCLPTWPQPHWGEGHSVLLYHCHCCCCCDCCCYCVPCCLRWC